MTLFAVSIAVTKDLPDIRGDRRFNINTFATKMGVSKIALLGILHDFVELLRYVVFRFRIVVSELYWCLCFSVLDASFLQPRDDDRGPCFVKCKAYFGNDEIGSREVPDKSNSKILWMDLDLILLRVYLITIHLTISHTKSSFQILSSKFGNIDWLWSWDDLDVGCWVWICLNFTLCLHVQSFSTFIRDHLVGHSAFRLQYLLNVESLGFSFRF